MFGKAIKYSDYAKIRARAYGLSFNTNFVIQRVCHLARDSSFLFRALSNVIGMAHD
jgi:hypothetical protein